MSGLSALKSISSAQLSVKMTSFSETLVCTIYVLSEMFSSLAAGENPKVVSERLGHSGVGLLLDTYAHVLPTMQQQAADRLDALLFNGK
jgi:integrase